MAETPPDLYTELLGLPPGPRPPDHYALLGLTLFEPDPHAIHEAILRQTAELKRWALHPDPDRMRRVQEMLNELSAAGVALEDPNTKAPYDEHLARQLGIALPTPEPRAVPMAPQPAPAAPPAPAPRPKTALPTPRALPPSRPSPATAEPAPATFWEAALDFLSAYWGWGLLAVGVLLAIWLPFALRRSPPEPQAHSEVATATPPAPPKPKTAIEVVAPARPVRPAPQPKSTKSPAPKASVEVYVEWPFGAVEAKRRQEATASALSAKVEEAVDLGGGVKLELVLVPAGKFVIGSPPSEQDRGSDEVQKPVTIEKPFWMGKYEVTQEQWQAIMGSKPARFSGMRNPVETASWDECRAFIAKLNEKVMSELLPPNLRTLDIGDWLARPVEDRTGRGFRLPTEGEWEWACRAGAATRFCFGDSDATLGDYAWYDANRSGGAHQVGEKRQNVWGLHDMHGNVWEWCASPYAERFDGSESKDEEAFSRRRVLRGGLWFAASQNCRSAHRLGPILKGNLDWGGFRVVCSARTSDRPAVMKLVPRAPRPKGPGPKVAIEVGVRWPFDAAETKRRQEETAKALGVKMEDAVDLGAGVKLDLVLIPAGEFVIGSPPSEEYRRSDEGQKRVTIDKPFWIGKYEVTQEQWQAMMGRNPARFHGPMNPVENVSWDDCRAFMSKVNEKVAGGGFRLPTEAEWE
ncbi:MAG: hypothetical protein FJ290_16980 [Planctomycetes bacterium]|nr:hypothetical protein [Planctomycetota bacterium]